MTGYDFQVVEIIASSSFSSVFNVFLTGKRAFYFSSEIRLSHKSDVKKVSLDLCTLL